MLKELALSLHPLQLPYRPLPQVAFSQQLAVPLGFYDFQHHRVLLGPEGAPLFNESGRTLQTELSIQLFRRSFKHTERTEDHYSLVNEAVGRWSCGSEGRRSGGEECGMCGCRRSLGREEMSRGGVTRRRFEPMGMYKKNST